MLTPLLLLLCCAVSKYFIFQTFATFLFQFLVGSVLSNISAIVDQITIIVNNPAIVVQILGVGAPQQATFFMSFVMINVSAACVVCMCASNCSVVCMWCV